MTPVFKPSDDEYEDERCDGRLSVVPPFARCGEPRLDDGTCWYCDTRRCIICNREVRFVDFSFCDGVCYVCVADAEVPPGAPAYDAAPGQRLVDAAA
jgi:hypothetical protein